MRKVLSFDSLEARTCLSDMTGMELAYSPAPAVVEPSVDAEMMQQLDSRIATELIDENAIPLTPEQQRLWDQVEMIRRQKEMGAPEAATPEEIKEALAPWTPAPAPTVEPSYLEQLMKALDDAMKAALDSQTPLLWP